MVEEKVRNALEKAKEKALEEKDYIMEVVRCLHEQFGGYAPPEALELAAQFLEVSPSKLYEIATFYSLYTLRKEAKHVIRVCTSLPCHVAGGREIIETLKKELNIDFGQVTPDGMFKLEEVGCLGRCDTSPNMMVDGTLYKDLTSEKVTAILEAYRKGVIE